MSAKESLLLHICCAPDAVYSLPFLRMKNDVTGFFYNPNIHPEKEYKKRLAEVEKLSKLQKYDLIIGSYEPEKWLILVKGMEKMPEYSKRCEVCIFNSLRQTALKAREMGLDCFATTLTNSPRKRIDVLNRLGEQIASETGVKYLKTDLKKKDGYLKSVKMCRILNIYRQNFCGCVYSRKTSAVER